MDPTTMDIIRCRANLSDQPCQDGHEADEEAPSREDGTYDGQTVVCNACYVALMPFTRSGQALTHEIAGTINTYAINLAFVRGHRNPQALAAQADADMTNAHPGTPLYASTKASRAMARRESARRLREPS